MVGNSANLEHTLARRQSPRSLDLSLVRSRRSLESLACWSCLVEDSMKAQPDQRQSSSEKVEIEAYLEAPVQSNSENRFCAEWSVQAVRLAIAGVRDSIADDSQICDRRQNAKNEAANQRPNIPSETSS